MPPCSLLIELKSLPAKTCGSYYTLLHRSVLYLVRCPIQSSAATKDSHAIKRLQDQVKKTPKNKNTQQHWNNTRQISKEQENH